MSAARTLTVLSRSWCSLCDTLLERLEPVAVELGWAVEVVDVADRPDLETRWSEDIPVVLHDTTELCRHFFDERAVRAYCARFPLKS